MENVINNAINQPKSAMGAHKSKRVALHDLRRNVQRKIQYSCSLSGYLASLKFVLSTLTIPSFFQYPVKSEEWSYKPLLFKTHIFAI